MGGGVAYLWKPLLSTQDVALEGDVMEGQSHR